VRVVDLGEAATAYGGRLLADLGADVVKVEPPAGDPLRARPPFHTGPGPDPDRGTGLVFRTYHANKRGVTLEVGRPEALELLGELGRADVVLLAPTRRRPVPGLDRDGGRLAWAGPRTVVCAVTPFGLTGPRRDRRSTPFVAFAASGHMHRCGPPDGPPLPLPGQQLWDEAGIHAALATVAALGARDRVGGQLLDLAVHEVAASRDFLLERHGTPGAEPVGRSRPVGIPPTGAWATADGIVEIAAHQARHWDAFLAAVDRPPELDEPALADPLVRRQLADGLGTVVARVLAGRGTAEVVRRGQEAGLPCSPRLAVDDVVTSVQARARRLFAPAIAGGGGPLLALGALAAAPPVTARRRPAPRLGEHDREVYVEELGHDDAELDRWRRAGLV
jgi:crotonobetainyl-CoA:carnitine CoA-transferase CaiB-like acyl-CoA transferase